MRFEVRAAAVLGVLLPMLETMRRGYPHWLVDFTTMFEDYFAGALLLTSGWLAERGRPYAKYCLLAAFAYTTGMMNSSFMGQIEATLRGNLEPHNTATLVFKGLMWSMAAGGLVMSFRRALASSVRVARSDPPPSR